MIIVSVENSKRKILIDDNNESEYRNEDTAFLLKEWGIKDASYTNGDVLEGVVDIVGRHLGDFTTLKALSHRVENGEINRFIGELYPKLAEWELEDRADFITHHDFVTDATGIKRYICLTFQDIHVFNR